EILCRLCEAKREIPRELRRLSVFADNHGRHHRLDQLASRSQVLWVEPHPLAGEIPEVCVCLEATKVERLAGDIEWVEGPRALSPSRRVDMPGDLAIALDGAGFAASVSGVRCELPNGIAGVVTFGGLPRPSGIWVESGGITRRAELEIPGVRVALRRPLCDSNWLTLAQSQVLKTAIDRCLDQAAKGPLRQHGAWREPLVAHLRAPSCPSFVRGLKVFCGPKQQYYSLRDFAADPKVVLADPIEAEQLAPNPDRPCVLLDEPINRQLLAARGGRLEQMALVAWESQRMPKPGPEFTLVVYQRIEQLLEDLANPGRLTVSRTLEAVCLRLPKVHARALRDPQGSACWLLAWQVSQALVIAYNENLHT
ncbi:MAG: hypothetical protein ACPG77_19380, partial [Nannocystaceae bacterium]